MAKKRTSTKTKKSVKKVSTAKVKTLSEKSPASRRLRQPQYKSFRVSKRIKHQVNKLPSSPRMFWRSLLNLKRHWKLFSGILLVYIILTLLLVKGFSLSSSNGDLSQTQAIQSLTDTQPKGLSKGLSSFGNLLGNGRTTSDVAAAYQSMLLIVMSLAIIWALRQTQAGAVVRVKDAFYKGLYPLAPLVLVLLVIGLQTIPLLAANALYGLVFGNSIAVTLLEKGLWSALFFLLAVLTLYMVTSSLFAIYIVTLPDVAPLQALSSARELVRFRRLLVMRKLLFLPLIMLIIGAIILVPLSIYLTVVAEWAYLLLAMVALMVVHSYIYTVYRELLK